MGRKGKEERASAALGKGIALPIRVTDLLDALSDVDREKLRKESHPGWTAPMLATLTDERFADPEPVALRLDFTDGGHLGYRIPRKFGEIGWVENVDGFVRDRGLGPDPSSPDFDSEVFRETLEDRRGMVKTTLMNQDLGNVYVDDSRVSTWSSS